MQDAPEDGGERQSASDQSFNGAVVGEAAGEQVAAADLECCAEEGLKGVEVPHGASISWVGVRWVAK